MQGGLREQLLDSRLLPGRQGVMKLHHVVEQGRLGEAPIDQSLERLLHPFEREHLCHEQVQHIGADAEAVLDRAGERGRECPLGLFVALRLFFGVCFSMNTAISNSQTNLAAEQNAC